MSMPQIPEEKHRPSLCEVIIDIFKSVALEETAISHILNAEAEKNQALVRKYQCMCHGWQWTKELGDNIRQTERLINTIIMKEWLLLRKLETAYQISTIPCHDHHHHHHHDCCDCFPDCQPCCPDPWMNMDYFEQNFAGYDQEPPREMPRECQCQRCRRRRQSRYR